MAGEGHEPPASRAGTRSAEVGDETVGLCSLCRFAATQRSAKGALFWRCRAADRDPRMLRYPPLPVTRCPAFERAASPRSTQPSAPSTPSTRRA